jgi:prolyl-tRNA synthetase
MKQSQLFTKTRKEAPSDEVAHNAKLLIRAGYVHKEMAGVYAYLPLGLRVLENIKQIVREEMDAIGGQEMIMTSLQRKELWEVTDRWSDENVDVWFKSELKNGTEVGFGWSHEEPITDMMKNFIKSYKDLPVFAYQFQTKMRNELRAKSGIMRGREFVMKDMYSYAIDANQHEAFYQSSIEAYNKVFDRCGLGDDTFVTFASGGAFTEFSHEFQTITDAGEDVIYINREKNIAINEEVLNDKTLSELGVTRDELEEVKTAEVGNIFNFGTKKCEQLGLNFVNDEGESVPVHLGSYGIGITRLMGVMVERLSDDNGLVWPKGIAPFDVHIVTLDSRDESAQTRIQAVASDLYDSLRGDGIQVLWDNRDESPGSKMKDSDLIGIPLRLVISERSLANDEIEWKERTAGEAQMISVENIESAVKDWM